MIYEQIEYQVRASLGRNAWVILIYYPDNAEGKPTTAKFTGTKAQAAGAARRKAKRTETASITAPRPPSKIGRPPGSKSRT